MDVSIIIVSWRVKEELKICLESINRETKNLEYEVFVVDNDSSDGTVEMLQTSFKNVKSIINKDNEGFAKACNQAIRESSGKYILLLNPDTEFRENAILKTFEFSERTKDAGITGCNIKNQNGTQQSSVRRFPDLLSHIFILLKVHNFYPNIFPVKHYYRFDWDYAETKSVEQVMGAFFMIKRSVINDIGLFDEHFYIWYEEVDYCKRALKNEWKTYYYSGASVIHQKAVSFSKQTAMNKQLILNRSMLYYFYKHKPLWNYFILLLLYPVSIALAFIVQTFGIKKTKKDL